jgi:adenylosuccinate lyase
VVLPDSSIALDYILNKATSLISGLVVYPQRMLENLNATRGLVFSGQLLLALTRKGVSRETAYEWVQRNAMRVWDEKLNFQVLVSEDKDIAGHLSAQEIDGAFSTDTYLRNIDAIFDRVFVKKESRPEPSAAAGS